MPFELLSEPIRRFVREKRWEALRPIQAAAISRILTTDDHYILASRTASGKTEAAFLPILSKLDFREKGVQVLYVSPLIALINDQFERIEDLCRYLDVTVTKWHGEAQKSLKNSLLREPNGVLLITPESLEAMFVNKPQQVKHLFSNLKFAVVDELHSFIGTDRGTHLKSLLSRLQALNTRPFRIIGLSATIGDYEGAKKFTGNESSTKVLLDRTAKETNAVFRYFKSEHEELPLELLKDLYVHTKDKKALIFPNSRGRAEEIAVKLRKISDLTRGHSNYFSHHSSIDKAERESVEHFAKNNNRQPFCICCTSTLELGMDIGAVDEVVQLDATHSIASLIQRVGRSGRGDGECGHLTLYATQEWSLLQSMACWLLYQEGFIEPPEPVEKPYDLLLHQALSIVKERSGIGIKELTVLLAGNFAFGRIGAEEIGEILDHLQTIGFLEKLGREVIIGPEGEKWVNDREFYSVFQTEDRYKVVCAGNTIGQIPFSPQIQLGENIFLAAKSWKIVSIDFKTKKMEVVAAPDGKKVVFAGVGLEVHAAIREKMLEILSGNVEYDFLDPAGREEIEKMRRAVAGFHILDIKTDRPLVVKSDVLELFTFTGTKVNRTLKLLLDLAGIENRLDEFGGSFEIRAPKEVFLSMLKTLSEPLDNPDACLAVLAEKNPSWLDFSKWGRHLPRKFQVGLLQERFFDLPGTRLFLDSLRAVERI